jgi:hypothetical protein
MTQDGGGRELCLPEGFLLCDSIKLSDGLATH